MPLETSAQHWRPLRVTGSKYRLHGALCLCMTLPLHELLPNTMGLHEAMSQFTSSQLRRSCGVAPVALPRPAALKVLSARALWRLEFGDYRFPLDPLRSDAGKFSEQPEIVVPSKANKNWGKLRRASGSDSDLVAACLAFGTGMT